MARLTKLNKKSFRWNDSEAFLDYRIKVAQKRGGFEDGWVDRRLFNKLSDEIFYCKFCGKPMYAAEYEKGSITMSCRTKPSDRWPKGCPGNIDYPEAREGIKHTDYDQREMTNQYFFNGRMRF